MKLLLAIAVATQLCLLTGCAAQGAPAGASPSKVEVFGDIDAGVSVRR